MITVSQLMIIERLLLEIETRFRFNLSFGMVSILYGFLREIGRITNLFFMLQEEYYNQYKDKDKLKEYHDKMLNDKVNINTSKMIGLIEDMYKENDDEEFKKLVDDNKFW